MAVLKRQSDRIAVLAGVPLFADLSKQHFTQIARSVSEVEFLPGDHLMIEGESGREAYVILEGSAPFGERARRSPR